MFRALGIASAATLTSVGVANLMALALLVASAQQNAMTAEALFSNGAILIKATFCLAAAIDADMVIRTVNWRETHAHQSVTAKLGIAGESRWTGTNRLVGNHSADGIGPT